MLLDRYRHVRKHRRALRTRNREEIRETHNRQAEVRLRPALPLVDQRLPAAAFDAQVFQRPGESIKSSGNYDDVQRVLLATRTNPIWRNLLDGALGASIHE